MLVNLMLSQGLLGNLHIIFPVFCSSALIFTILSFTSFIHSSALLILLLIPSSVLFISVCLSFSSYRSLVNISYILSNVFLRSWLIITIILNFFFFFSGRLSIFNSFSCFSVVLSCSFIWNTLFCCPCLSKFLCVFLCMWQVSQLHFLTLEKWPSVLSVLGVIAMHFSLILQAIYTLGVPPKRAVWVLLLQQADSMSCLIDLVGPQSGWLPGSALCRGAGCCL